MKDLFCNECGLSYDVPHLVAEWLLGVEHLHRIESRYEQMRKCYDYTYAEWQQVFSEDLKPFSGTENTTSVTISIGSAQLGIDIKTLHRGAIGVDLPTWFNIKDNQHIMLIAQDPLRSCKWYGECFDAVVSSPFGQQDLEHRQKGNGGKMMSLLVKILVDKGCGVYLTDANKFFVYNHKETNRFSVSHSKVYADILHREIEFVKPSVIVCLGRRAERLCRTFDVEDILPLPHLSGSARGAMMKKFPKLNECGATVENIAEEYAVAILEKFYGMSR